MEFNRLFSSTVVSGLELKNHLTMAPLYLGYSGEGGTVSQLQLDHYRLMAQSGVAMVVVENATIDHPTGSGSNRTLRADTDDNLQGLSKLAAVIKEEGALACLQLNHAGRFSGVAQPPVAPSAVEIFGKTPHALDRRELRQIVQKYADAALRVRKAGFDMIELHGGTGYLLAQFVSPRTNKRADEYGGTIENRQRFPLEVLTEVRDAVGDSPVGYRFLADEWFPDGLKLSESKAFARNLSVAGVAYISVMGGTHESFLLPEIAAMTKARGYMVSLASDVREVVDVPVIAAGRIATGTLAEKIISEGHADLIGLARVLWADPEWPSKVKERRENEIVHCDPECDDACTQMLKMGRPAFCVKWPAEKMRSWKAKVA